MQEFSERKESKLSLDNYESFVPKSIKFLEKDIKIDLKSIEYSEEDNLGVSIKDDDQKDIILRKQSSTRSTSFSKIDEFSEGSCPNSPTNKENINFKLLNKIYSTPVSNYFLGIDEYFKDVLPERLEYNKTGNYITKEKYFKEKNKKKNEKNFSENQKKLDLEEEVIPNNTINKTIQQNDQTNKVIGAIPVTNSQIVNGKFDIPMYCVGFYSWDGKLFFISLFIKFFKL